MSATKFLPPNRERTRTRTCPAVRRDHPLDTDCQRPRGQFRAKAIKFRYVSSDQHRLDNPPSPSLGSQHTTGAKSTVDVFDLVNIYAVPVFSHSQSALSGS